jgi:hypothetical protein
MEKIDRDIAQLAVFKTSNIEERDEEEDDYGDENCDSNAIRPISPKNTK